MYYRAGAGAGAVALPGRAIERKILRAAVRLYCEAALLYVNVGTRNYNVINLRITLCARGHTARVGARMRTKARVCICIRSSKVM